jgi:hypothetical protein
MRSLKPRESFAIFPRCLKEHVAHRWLFFWVERALSAAERPLRFRGTKTETLTNKAGRGFPNPPADRTLTDGLDGVCPCLP